MSYDPFVLNTGFQEIGCGRALRDPDEEEMESRAWGNAGNGIGSAAKTASGAPSQSVLDSPSWAYNHQPDDSMPGEGPIDVGECDKIKRPAFEDTSAGTQTCFTLQSFLDGTTVGAWPRTGCPRQTHLCVRRGR